MESEEELLKARNEVFRKIGRNMLLFQTMEHLLKFINANSMLSGNIGEENSQQKQKTEDIHKHTLGRLVGEFFDNTYSEHNESTEETEALYEDDVSYKFEVNIDSVSYKNKQQVFSSIVTDRNDLIHHLLPTFNPESIKSCLETNQRLDQQRKKLLPEINALKSMISSMQEGRKQLAELFSSDEFNKQFELLFLKQSCLIPLLADIAIQAARSDGWTFLSIAGQLIRQQEPDEMDALNKRFGHKTLKNFILATELFDINEEPTNKGKIHVLYRPKPDWMSKNNQGVLHK